MGKGVSSRRFTHTQRTVLPRTTDDMVHAKTAVLSAMAAGAIAAGQHTPPVVGMMVPGQVTAAYGSIINIDSHSVTTAYVRCPKGVYIGDPLCSIGESGGTLKQGPSTWLWTKTESQRDAT